MLGVRKPKYLIRGTSAVLRAKSYNFKFYTALLHPGNLQICRPPVVYQQLKYRIFTP